MKLKEITNKLAMLDKFRHPIIFIDNDNTTFILKYRKSVELPFSFYEKYNYEIGRHMDEILNLDITFISDENNTLKVYLKNFSSLMAKIDGGKDI